jgi:hypothetical protein
MAFSDCRLYILIKNKKPNSLSDLNAVTVGSSVTVHELRQVGPGSGGKNREYFAKKDLTRFFARKADFRVGQAQSLHGPLGGPQTVLAA